MQNTPRSAAWHGIIRPFTTSQHRLLPALLLWLLVPLYALASTPGSLDTSFNTGTGFNGTVYASAVQPDGKVLVAGNFTSFNGTTRNRIARLNADGSLDNTFNPGTGADAYIYSLALQADGKIVIGGGFTQFNGSAANYITRLNADGTLDNNFATTTSTDGAVRSVIILRSGKIMVGGNFSTANSTPRSRLARFNTDGTLDSTFINTQTSNTVWAIAEQPDGMLVIGGEFISINGFPLNRIARISADGLLDTSFTVSPGANATVFSLALQPDNKIVLGGLFSFINSTSRNRIARLNTNGTLDATFNPGSGFDTNSIVTTVQLQADRNILVGGSFISINGTDRSRISRLNQNGSVDTTFDPGTGTTGAAAPYIFTITTQTDGKLLLGGEFTQYNNTTTPYLVRISSGDTDIDGTEDAADAFVSNDASAVDADTDGLPDAWLQPNPYSCAPMDSTCNGLTLDTLIDSTDKDNIASASDNCPTIYNPDQIDTDDDNIGNICDSDSDNDGINNNTDNCLLTENSSQLDDDTDGIGNLCDSNPAVAPNASRDVSFNIGSGFNNTIQASAVQTDGKIILAGDFTTANGVTQNHVARLNTDGSLDSSFINSTGGNVYALTLQADGKAIIGGYFSTVNATLRYNIARLNHDGALDASFTSSTNGSIYALAVQPDGKVVIGGQFTTVNGVARNKIARLNSDGSLDTGFHPIIDNSNSAIYALSLQNDGYIVLAGNFATVNNAPRSNIARINIDGALDISFNASTSSTVKALSTQPDKKIILVGDFVTVNGVANNKIARLNINGSLDNNFNSGTGADSAIQAVLIQEDGKIVIGGHFTSINNIVRNRIARLNSDGTLDLNFDPEAGANNAILTLCLESGGRLIAGGIFTVFNNTVFNHAVRIHTGDADEDGIEDAADAFANNTAAATDADADGLPDAWLQPNSYSCAPSDTSCNGLTLDTLIDSGDRDNIASASDNCSYLYNPDQVDTDSDGTGNACDPDMDNDNQNNIEDNCPLISNNNQQDSDADGTGDVCDPTPTVAPTASRDALFNTNLNSAAHKTIVQPDGKLLISGDFTQTYGDNRSHFIRLNSDGSADKNFSVKLDTDNMIHTMAVQPDGKIIIGGAFGTVNNMEYNGIARLNIDGSLDTNFNPGTGTDNSVTTLAIQPDGKIILGGLFTTINGTARNRIARLNADGSLDTNFDIGTGADGDIYTLTLQPDGKIILGGNFNSVNGSIHNGIERLNADGTLDNSFASGYFGGISGTVSALALQRDGKIVMTGAFNAIYNTPRHNIGRLNIDGSLDTEFDPGSGVNGSSFNALVSQADGKIILGGEFTSVNGVARSNIARFNPNGSVDLDFTLDANAAVNTLALHPSGRLIVGGSFTAINELPANYLARIHTGNIDADNIEDGSDKFHDNAAAALDDDDDGLADNWPQPNLYNCTPEATTCNGLLLDNQLDTDLDGLDDRAADNCPYVTNVDQADIDGDGIGNACDPDNDNDGTVNIMDNCPLLINDQQDSDADGTGDVCDLTPTVAPIASLDMSFNIGTGFDNTVYASAVQNDNKVIVGGSFVTANGMSRNRIARLNADGSIDTDFNQSANNTVYAIAIQSDGKIVIAGAFTTINSVTRQRITRLNSNGTLDSSFNIGSGPNGTVNTFALQPDGKIIIGGSFSTVNGVARSRIARLNTNGSLDTSFNPGTGIDRTVYAIAIQSDGKIIIGGEFTSVNGISRTRVARIHSDGSLDINFYSGTGGNGTVYALAVQPNDKVVIGGNFSSMNGGLRNHIAQLNANGTLDIGFPSGTGANSTVRTLAIQRDGNIILGGSFTLMNGEAHNGMARLHANGSIDTSFNPSFNTDWSNLIQTLALRPNGRLIVGGEFTIVNNQSANHLTSIHTGNVDADGIEDGADTDSDNDGTANAQDAFPLDPSEQLDTDSDSIGNNADLDDDGDGVPDYIDAEPLNASNANEATLPLNGNYKGSVIRDNAALE